MSRQTAFEAGSQLAAELNAVSEALREQLVACDTHDVEHKVILAVLARVRTAVQATVDVLSLLLADNNELDNESALRAFRLIRSRAAAGGVLPEVPAAKGSETSVVEGLDIPDSRLHCLQAIVADLTVQERSVEFHTALRKAVERAAAESPDSCDAFTFGATPLATFTTFMSSPPVQAAMQRHGPQLMVFGSSTGALVFFGRLSLKMSCTGYEILPFLAERAEAMRKKHSVDNVSLRCADCLTADASKQAVVILCSLCWPEPLRTRVCHKLGAELPDGAAVVTYGDCMSDSSAFGGGPAWTQRLATSWASRQRLCVYVKQTDAS